jgi:transposase
MAKAARRWASTAITIPDLKQMILGLVVDGDGRPICTEMWPGNTADVTTLLPVVDRLRDRFSVGRVCVVADRGMISAATIVCTFMLA